MSVTQNITASNKWFIGEDKIIEFETLSDDGKAIDDATKTPYDVTGKALVYSLKTSVFAADPGLIEKRTAAAGGTGVNIVGIYNASRALNTQRVQVVIRDSDTDGLSPSGAKLHYYHSLKDLTNDAETVLVDGTVELLKSTAPPT